MVIYQLRVELHEAESPKWRRLLVPPSITLHDLNTVVQESMGLRLYGYQFYSFKIHRGDFYGPKDLPDVDLDPPVFDDREITLALALPRPNLRMSHTYAPGDDLRHNVILQKIISAHPGVRYPHCAAGSDGSAKINPTVINNALAKLELSSPGSEPIPAMREAMRRIKHRRLEGAKPPGLIDAQLFRLTDTVKDRPALAVRNAGLLLLDTVWSVLAAHAAEPAEDDDLSTLLDEATRLAGVTNPLRGNAHNVPATLESVLGISPDLASLHAGVNDSDARQAVDAAFEWCKPLLDTLPGRAWLANLRPAGSLAASGDAATYHEERTLTVWRPIWATGGGPGSVPPPFGDAQAVTALACVEVNRRPTAVTGDAAGTVRLWDLTTRLRMGEPMAGHRGGIVALAAAVLKGRPVAVTAGSDGILRLWDLRDAQEPGPAFAGDTAEVTALACMDLGGQPVAVTGGADGAVRVWDLVTRQQIGGVLTGHAGPVGDVACIPVEEHSAAVTRGEADGTIRVWDLVHRRQIGEPLRSDAGQLTALACTRLNGRAVAVGAASHGALLVWDLRTLRRVGAPLVGNSDPVASIACVQVDGEPIAVTVEHRRRAVRVWDLRRGEQVGKPLAEDSEHARLVSCTSIGGKPVALSVGKNGAMRVRDLTGRWPIDDPRAGHTAEVQSVASIDLDARGVVVTASQDDTVRVWDATDGQPIGALPADATTDVRAVTCAYSHGRPVVVTLHGDGDAPVRVFDLASLRQTGAVDNTPPKDDESFGGNITGAVACVESDGHLLAVTACEYYPGADKYLLWVWDLTTGKRVGKPFNARAAMLWSLAASTVNGRPVAVTAGGDDHAVRVWDLLDRKQIGEPMTGHTDQVEAIACTELDGRPVAVTSSDDSIRVWDLTSQREIGEPMTGPVSTCGSLACTHLGGRPIAFAASWPDATLVIWDLVTRTTLDTITLPAEGAAVAATNDVLVAGFGTDIVALRHPPSATTPAPTDPSGPSQGPVRRKVTDR